MAPGVYRFRDAPGRVLYIGRAGALRSRVASYWSDLGGRDHLGPMVARIARIEAISCDSAHEAAWLERNLLETSLPRWNRTPGGQERAVCIRMGSPQRVTTMDAARLTVAGWSGGVLVQFSIYGGRLCRWSQCICSRSAAAGALAATPAAWRDFTQRNAELAASLAQPR